jgi:hypothetical protein
LAVGDKIYLASSTLEIVKKTFAESRRRRWLFTRMGRSKNALAKADRGKA